MLRIENKGRLLDLRKALGVYKVSNNNVISLNDQLNFALTPIFSIIQE